MTVNHDVAGSSPAVGAKKDQVERLGLFLSIAKAMVYHHALACISSALTSISRQSEHIISRRLYFAFAMMIYKAFRFDDMQFLTELMICTPTAWFYGELHFCTTMPKTSFNERGFFISPTVGLEPATPDRTIIVLSGYIIVKWTYRLL